MSATRKPMPANTLRLAKCLEEEASCRCKDFGEIEHRLKDSRYEVNIEEPDTQGRSALMIACQNGLEGVVKYLLDRGADVDKEYDSKEDPEDVENDEDVGMTPLMIACKYGFPCIVDMLIAHGAEVNKECSFDCNKPLHFAVTSQHGRRWSITDQTDQWKKPMTQKLEIVKSLLLHGAAKDANEIGLDPLEHAALNSSVDILKYLISDEQNKLGLQNANKVHALELLAFSLTTQEHCTKLDSIQLLLACGASSSYEYRNSLAAEALEEAMQLRRQEASSNANRDEVQQMEALFGRSECKTVDDLVEIKSDEFEMRKEGFLIGARIIPDELLEEMLFEPLLKYGSSLLRIDKIDEGFEVLSFCLKQEMEDGLFPGCTYSHIAPSECPGMKSVHGQKKYLKLLESFCEMLSQVSLCFLDLSGNAVLKATGDFILTIASKFDSTMIDEALGVMEKIVSIFNHRLPSSSRIIKEKFCFAHSLLHIAVESFLAECDCPNFHSKRFYRRVHQFVTRFLFHEDSSHAWKDDGRTMLHTLMKMVNRAHPFHFNFILPMASTLVHHGCPVDAKSRKGKTAAVVAASVKDCCYRTNHRQCPQYDEVMQLLTMQPLASLQELAGRVILRHQIPYRSKVPSVMWDVLENGIHTIKLSETEATEYEEPYESGDSLSETDSEEQFQYFSSSFSTEFDSSEESSN